MDPALEPVEPAAAFDLAGELEAVEGFALAGFLPPRARAP
jgi:hypothetical protein